jgi:hypothetical protein
MHARVLSVAPAAAWVRGGIGHDQNLAKTANGQQAVRGVLSYVLLVLLGPCARFAHNLAVIIERNPEGQRSKTSSAAPRQCLL